MDITKFTVMENTGRYRAGKWVPDDAANPHHVEAKSELGTTATQLQKGDQVIVIGYERTNSWQKDGEERQYRRVIEADQIGASITSSRTAGENTAAQDSDTTSDAPDWEVVSIGAGK